MARLPVLIPTENGGVGEGNQTNEQHQRAEYGNLLEGRGGGPAPEEIVPFAMAVESSGLASSVVMSMRPREQADNDSVPRTYRSWKRAPGEQGFFVVADATNGAEPCPIRWRKCRARSRTAKPG